ncbi:uncharacterized protein ColSpa_01725 [Colletotrichum spaethianum]|uniref:Uncharacterized protein n=1 Tax=Colletotrichum spaethianum TaxID=700344 RepID=A0AA37L6J1_9PEZI|nr:uncharacterized protein ColSpa_01725 [Colletotrichum spaethianum]GKT41544.1 hypothetical protein ColSpa_01725 [Colletotrichum spaethianum]
MFRPDPAQVAELQRKYSGLDNNLAYVAGHTIDNKYSAYKAADKAAAAASSTYKRTANVLKQKKPYDLNNPALGPVGGRGMYTREGHQTLAPLAGTASSIVALTCWKPRDNTENT